MKTQFKFNFVNVVLAVFLFAGLPALSFSQTREQIKAQAESVLQGMTPSQIDQKLAQLGISRQEAESRAAEYGISLQDYLSKVQVSAAPVTTQPATGLSVPQIPPQTTPAAAPAASKGFDVPGFAGRAGITSAVQPIGYDIFQYPSSTFQPVENVATPASYILGPGDEIVITVWGQTDLRYQLMVNRDGEVIVPVVGPVHAAGLSVSQFRERLLRRMTTVYAGLKNGAPNANTFMDLSLGKLRTIQVFVLGEVVRPGGYLVSSMSTVLQALYLSGGPNVNGTLRNIKIVRSGDTTATIDLYNYILRGDKSSDIRLQDGDIVFVKPADKRAALVGDVVRPGIYELKENETLSDLLKLAGGLRFDAYYNRIHIERVVPFSERKIYSKDLLDIDLHFNSVKELEDSPYAMVAGDIVTVFKISDRPQDRVVITGNVYKPGNFQLTPGMRVSDLIMEADSLQMNTFADRALLFRLLPNLRREVMSFNPLLALEKDPSNDLLLKNQDEVQIFQESQFFPQHSVTISGAVRKPGSYVRNNNMTVADLVMMAGGLTENADTSDWEVSRIDTTNIRIYSHVYKISVSSDYWNPDGGQTFALKDFDHVNVPTNPKYNKPKIVQIEGYVLYPGSYTITKEEETLDDLLKRAGGLRPGAYPSASFYYRSLNNAGMIPIDFPKAFDDPSSKDNLQLQQGDSIYIGMKTNVVYVRGDVFVPSAILYKPGAGPSYYVAQAGGMKEDADEDRISVFLPGGKRWEPEWFIIPNPDILPGSSIYVPVKVQKPSQALEILRDWSTIVMSLATVIVSLYTIIRYH